MTSLSCEALRDDILALLYDDGAPAERARARDHLAQCVPCRVEYGEFKSVRKALGGWTLPASETAPKPVVVVRPATRWMTAGLAAAAGLILGLGLAVAGRSYFLSAPAASPAVTSAARSESAAAIPRLGLARVARRAAGSAQGSGESPSGRTRRASPGRFADGRRRSPQGAVRTTNISNLSPSVVERLLRASEERQARLIEARLAGLRTETDLQRQYDMAQIAAGLAYIDSRTGADAARTSELMKNLVRVTAKPQDR
jgi:hypothetical protein